MTRDDTALQLDRATSSHQSSLKDAPFWPLAPAQQAVLMRDEWARLHGSRASGFNFVECRRLRGPLDRCALEAALRGLVDRHVVLRTVVRPSSAFAREERLSALAHFWVTSHAPEGLYVQNTIHHCPVELRYRDLQHLPQERQERVLMDVCLDETVSSFDLSEAPLIRAHLHRYHDEEHVLVLCVPHYAVDALSMQLCWRDFFALYRSASSGAADQLPPVVYDFHAFVDRQRQRNSTGGFDASLAYWREQWAGMSRSTSVTSDDLDFVQPGSHAVATGGRAASLHLDAATSAGLRRVTRQLRLPPSVVFLAAFARWLQLHTGRSLVAPWVPLANRVEPGTENLVGFLVNAHALPIQIDPELTRHELLMRCRVAMHGALTHQECPLQFLLDRMATRQIGSTRLVFNYVTIVPTLVRNATLVVEHVPAVAQIVSAPSGGFDVRVAAHRDHFVMFFLYAAGRFTPKAVMDSLHQYGRILVGLVSDLSAPVSTLA